MPRHRTHSDNRNLYSRTKTQMSRAEYLIHIYRLMKQGVSYEDAKREINNLIAISDPPVRVELDEEDPSRSNAIERAMMRIASEDIVSNEGVMRVRSVTNNGAYPLEVVSDEPEVIDVNGVEYAFIKSQDDVVIGIDAGVPGSDRTACVVKTRKGSITATFVITREGDDLIVKAEDGSILGRGDSEEEVMKILQVLSTSCASELLEVEESLENTSRFDIIDIE